jgi:hypothetical protein
LITPAKTRVALPAGERLNGMETTSPSWQSVIQFQGELTPAAARALLRFGFSAQDQARMAELSAKARAGTLTPPEQADLDTFERLGCLLDIVHSKARQALKRKPQRAS